MIVEVLLKNWRSHGEGEDGEGNRIVFEPGLNVIYGVNGSGKSSVVEAIAYALFGENIRFGHVLREGKQAGKVEVVFTVDGEMFKVRREFTAVGTLSSILLDGRGRPLEVAKSKEVSRRVERLLGIDSKLFYKAIYGAQNRITELFDETGQRRAEIFDKILGMEELAKARHVLRRVYNVVEAELRGLNVAEMEAERRRLEEEREQLVKKITEVMVEKQEVAKELESLRRELVHIQERVRRAEEKYREFLRVRERMREVEGRIGAIVGQIKFYDVDEGVEERLKEAEGRLRRAEALVEEKSSLLSKVETLRRELNSLPKEEPPSPQPLEEELDSLERKRKEIERRMLEVERREGELIRKREEARRILRRIEELREELKRVMAEREKIREQVVKGGVLEEKMEEVRRALERVVAELGFLDHIEKLKIMDRCPVCGAPLGEEQREEIVRRGEERRTELVRIRENLRREMERLEGIKREIERMVGRMGELEAREALIRRELEVLRPPNMEEVEEELRRVEEDKKKYREEIGRIVEEEKVLIKRIDELRRLWELWRRRVKLEEEIRGLRERLEEVEKELGRLGDVRELRRRIEELKEMVRSLQLLREKEALEGELKALRERAELLGEVEEEYGRVRREYERLVGEVEARKVRQEGLEKLLSEMGKRLEDVERVMEGLEERVKRAERLKEWKNTLLRLLEAWESTVSEVRKMRMEAVNRALKLVWRRVYMARYSDYRDIELVQKSSRGRYTYELLLKGERGWREVEKLSGGEKTLALLALRIAVSYLLSGRARILILDEPTHNLDAELSRQFAAFLKEATSEQPLFTQIIVITHNPVFAEEADVVYRFEREKTGNDPTRIVREK